ncbi:hypothetical protein DSM106972_007130 [Dulcicalothrix desertica PCC 7102]|uniref:Uncharacterized protein n=1 Tax=Dulcicalothrix desertica PCC 7102 TaxID=232991 RepID=A0A3S1AVP7_9CYAN|nr:hypothetical protein [Dulcicalothrix desertica]RUT10218.1 hypothetical protein DSM106972_007130 [Dulcicalothrix desertica PCC 7102]TWH40804.1 hypothetical protein CAL7102_10162 [Dulcicalothrix desertica PCC 7102]
MSQSDSLLVKLRKHIIIKQSDLLLVKLRKYYFITFFAGALGGFAGGLIHAIQHFHSFSPQIVIIITLISGINYSSAEIVSLLGNTWWQRVLLWVTTIIIISGLIHLLVQSLDFDFVLRSTPFVPTALLNYLNRKLSVYKKR